MTGFRSVTAALFLVVALLAGCAHYPPNDPLTAHRPDGGYRFGENPAGTNTNSLFVCLAFSGGGTRAAALSYGVLEKLRDTRIRWKGVEKRLLDEVDCISSISGGSFTAAYYGLFGERLFSDFRPRFLDRNIQSELVWQVANPLNWFRLASPTFSRIDLAAELYDETVFDNRRFADLPPRERGPFVMINATNLVNGGRFEFTQDEFDLLGSDLATYPVARAVAASSAFPFLLSPVSLINHPAPPGYTPPRDLTNALNDYGTNRRRYQWARDRIAYLDKEARPFVHLMDGGLADNIGLRGVESAYQRSSGRINRLINDGAIEKLVIIIVNARTEDQDSLSSDESPPGLKTVAFKTATISLDNYSFETVEFMKELRRERVQAEKNLAACQERLDRCPGSPPLPTFTAPLDPYVVEVNFEALPDPDRRRQFLSLPTSFSLTRQQIDDLIGVSGELLDSSADFRALLQGLQ